MINYITKALTLIHFWSFHLKKLCGRKLARRTITNLYIVLRNLRYHCLDWGQPVEAFLLSSMRELGATLCMLATVEWHYRTTPNSWWVPVKKNTNINVYCTISQIGQWKMNTRLFPYVFIWKQTWYAAFNCENFDETFKMFHDFSLTTKRHAYITLSHNFHTKHIFPKAATKTY